MKKLLLIVPVVFLLTACGDFKLEGSVDIPQNSENRGNTNTGGNSGKTTNPGGNGEETTEPGGEGGEETTEPETPEETPAYDTKFNAMKDTFNTKFYMAGRY